MISVHIHTGKILIFTGKYILINKVSFFQAKNEVKISKNTNPPLQKTGDQVSKGDPWISQFITPPQDKSQKFSTHPLFKRGGGVRAMNVWQHFKRVYIMFFQRIITLNFLLSYMKNYVDKCDIVL